MYGLKVSIQAEIRDGKGKLLKRTRKKVCKSYVRQMTDLLYLLSLSADAGFKDTSNASKTASLHDCGADGYMGKVEAIATNDLFGIQVGTGVNAPAIADYHLQTKIAHGNSATQLAYGAVTLGTVAIVGSIAKYTIARPFTNNSGSDIDVKEVGLVVAFEDNVPALFYVMVEHTLLSFTVANGTTGTVTYTLSVST